MEKRIHDLVGTLGGAIPATSLAKGFHVPDLGMRIAFLTPEQSASTLGAMPAGAVVMEVESGRPMAKSGIHVGDVVVSIGGKKIGSEDDLRQAIFKIGPGKNSIFVPPQRRYQNRGGRLRKLQS
jgi:S1-C subfamily serine protease